MTNQLEDAPTKTEQEEAPNQDMNFNNPSDYGCQILLEKTTLDAANDKTFPNDARLVWYIVDGTEYIDLTRCGKVVKMFDMYYDRYGPGSVQKIDFGFGTVNPKLWGLKKKESKKKMSEGFDVEVEMPKEDINRLLKQYKKLKKYQKSSLYQIEKLSGKKTKVDELIDEYGVD